MAERIFIGYRSADGRDKATALARDLGARFGAEQVFLDKDDLPAGGAWRQDVAGQMGPGTVALLLLTPQYLGAQHANGALRIHDADDPVRRELQAALDSGAHLIPMLCDDTPAPDAAALPAPFPRLAEHTYRPLRAYDWVADVRRLGDDLAALGVPQAPRRRRWLLGGGAALALAAGAAAWQWARPKPLALRGAWALQGPRQAPVRLTFEAGARPQALRMHSAPVDIRADPAWADYRQFWRERFGAELDSVVWRGEGQLADDGSGTLQLDMALAVRPAGAPLAEPIATGNLSGQLPAALAPRMAARLWWNAEQRAQDVTLLRGE